MRSDSRFKIEVDLQWQQRGPDEWVALITDRKTGRRLEAHSTTELWEALEGLSDGGSGTKAPPEAEEVEDTGESHLG